MNDTLKQQLIHLAEVVALVAGFVIVYRLL